MSKQRHDIGWQKAHREDRQTSGQAAAVRRGRVKAAKAARRAELLEAAYLAGERTERDAIKRRERAAADDALAEAVEPEPQPTPVPAPAPPPTPEPQPAPVKACAHCNGPMWTNKRYCCAACRLADRPVVPPAKGAMRDRRHRTLLGSK